MSKDDDTICFVTDHLLAKWGFADAELLNDFLRNNGFEQLDEESDEWYQFSRRVLCEVVERYVLPEIQNDIKPYRVTTSHNPVRVYEVDGRRVDEPDIEPSLKPPEVEVSKVTVLETASTLFQKRFDENGQPYSYMERSPEAIALFKRRSWL